MDRLRNWTERNNKAGTPFVWQLWEVSKFIGKLAVGFLIFSLFLLGVLFPIQVAAAEAGRVPKEPPAILAHSPETDATQVPVNSAISVVWDRPMRPDSSFSVTGPEGFVPGAFLYDPDTYTVTFIPDENLAPDTRYGVLVAGQIDREGQVQQIPYQWNFSTVAPTSVSIVSLGTPPGNPLQDWLWASWPWLMALISIVSLAGFLGTWGRRRFISPAEKTSE